MEHTVQAYLRRQSTQILETLLRQNTGSDTEEFSEQILEDIRNELARREETVSQTHDII